MAVTIKRKLDLLKDPVDIVKPIHLRRGEEGETTIEAEITVAGETLSLMTYIAWFMAILDGETISHDASVSVRSNTVSFTVTPDITSGLNSPEMAYFKLMSGSKFITTPNIPIIID